MTSPMSEPKCNLLVEPLIRVEVAQRWPGHGIQHALMHVRWAGTEQNALGWMKRMNLWCICHKLKPRLNAM